MSSQDSTTETADLPGWSPPRRSPRDDPLDPGRTTQAPPPGPGTPEGDLWGEGPGAGEDEEQLLRAHESRTGTSRGAGPSPAFTDPATYAEPIAAVVGIASVGIHYARRAQGDLWLADEDDVAAIAGPLARIAARHSPVAGEQAADVADGIMAAIGVAGYAMKNIRRELAIDTAPVAPQAAQEGPGAPRG